MKTRTLKVRVDDKKCDAFLEYLKNFDVEIVSVKTERKPRKNTPPPRRSTSVFKFQTKTKSPSPEGVFSLPENYRPVNPR